MEFARERSRTPPKLSSSAKRRYRRRMLQQDKSCKQPPLGIIISRERFLQLRCQWKLVPVSVCHGLDDPAIGSPSTAEVSNDLHMEVWLATPAPPVQSHCETELVPDASCRPVHAALSENILTDPNPSLRTLVPRVTPTRIVTQDELAQRASLALADASKRRRVQTQAECPTAVQVKTVVEKADSDQHGAHETSDANDYRWINSLRNVCGRCWPARLQMLRDEETGYMDVCTCICAQLLCFHCVRPGSFCTCSEAPSFVEERCMICDLALHDCLEDVKCSRCHSRLQDCLCESPLLTFDENTCEEGCHHYSHHINWNDGVDAEPVVCSRCQQFLPYEEQFRCDASACMSECGGSGSFQQVCFFHENCLERVSDYMLCPLCTQANNLPSENSESEDMNLDDERCSQFS